MPDLDPPDARIEQLLREGLALHGQMQLSEARLLYEQVLQLQPAKFPRSVSFGQHRAAIPPAATRARADPRRTRLDSSDAAAHNDYGHALYELKRYKAAIASFDRAIALDPGFAGFYTTAMALYDLGRYEAAIASFDQAIARNLKTRAPSIIAAMRSLNCGKSPRLSQALRPRFLSMLTMPRPTTITAAR